MNLSNKEIEHIAFLSRIQITDEELKNFSSQLSNILEYVSKLQEVDTNNVDETARVSQLANIFDEDKAIPSAISQKDLMGNAPETKESYFKVRTVLE